MISFVKGTVADIGENFLIMENGGLGYEIYMTGQDLEKAHIGDEKKIHTFLYVREDILQLYGFFSKDDLGMFKLLIGVNGHNLFLNYIGFIRQINTVSERLAHFCFSIDTWKT